jgi:hypothetical protein
LNNIRHLIYITRIGRYKNCDAFQAEMGCDIQKTLQWQLTETTRAPICCLASSSRIWLLRRQRLLTGREALSLQGWGMDNESNTTMPDFSDAGLYNLAGNAMNGCRLSMWGRVCVAVGGGCT